MSCKTKTSQLSPIFQKTGGKSVFSHPCLDFTSPEEIVNYVLDGKADYIDGGADGVVYSLGNGFVAKMGLIRKDEAKIQNWLATEHKSALPVIAYHQNISSDADTKDKLMLAFEDDMGNPYLSFDILVMPQAEEIEGNDVDFTDVESNYIRVAGLVRDKFNRELDYKPDEHSMLYNGNLVVIDFGFM